MASLITAGNALQFCGWGRTDAKTPRERILEASRLADEAAAKFAKPFFIKGQAETGAGKCARIHKFVKKVTGKNPRVDPQLTGDCFIAGTMVSMADGTEKPIEKISIGDLVFTHTGVKALVTRLHSRNYSGPMNTIVGWNIGRPVTSTASHEFVEVHGNHREHQDWVSASHLTKETRILVPAGMQFRDECEVLDVVKVCGCNPNENWHRGTVVSGCIQSPDAVRGKIRPAKNPIPSHITVNGDFARLIGLYLSEGGAEGWKVQFSFSSTEKNSLVRETQSLLLSVFGLNSTQTLRHENESCIVVQCHSLALVKFLKALIPGNVYSKTVPDVILRAPYHVRMSCLRAWIDGDGCYMKCKKNYTKLIGVTASRQMSIDLMRMSLGLGILPSLTQRKKLPNRRFAASDLSFNGESAQAVGTKSTAGIKRKVTEHGFTVRVKSNESHVAENVMVYCIEVDHPDHSFIANSYAVHNCVSTSARLTLILRMCAEICNGDIEKYMWLFSPFHYATGRVLIGKNQLRGGAGSLGGWQAQANAEFGFLAEQDAGGLVYSKALADAWGDDKKYQGKSFRDFMTIAKPTNLVQWARTQSWNEVRDGLYHGYPQTICSSRGYTMMPKNGFHLPSGNWPHALTLYAYWENVKVPTIAIINTWGDVHGDVFDPETGEQLPEGTILVRLEDFVKYHLLTSSTECIAYSGIDGFDAKIDWSEFF